MRTSPAGWAATRAQAQARRTAVNAAVTTAVAANRSKADIATAAQMTEQELDGFLAQDELSVQVANTILAGISPDSTLSETATVGPYPDSTDLPAITNGGEGGGSGLTDVQVGDVLTVDDGTWTDDTPAFTYEWFRVISGTKKLSIGTASTYTTVSADVGFQITAEVTNTDANGAFTQASPDVTVAVVA